MKLILNFSDLFVSLNVGPSAFWVQIHQACFKWLMFYFLFSMHVYFSVCMCAPTCCAIRADPKSHGIKNSTLIAAAVQRRIRSLDLLRRKISHG